jgi:protein subunit release factor A
MSDIPERELRVEGIYLGTGTTERPGGQQAGMPAMAVRVTHIPSGIMAQVHIGRSQHIDRLIALDMIEAAITHPKFR